MGAPLTPDGERVVMVRLDGETAYTAVYAPMCPRCGSDTRTAWVCLDRRWEHAKAWCPCNGEEPDAFQDADAHDRWDADCGIAVGPQEVYRCLEPVRLEARLAELRREFGARAKGFV